MPQRGDELLASRRAKLERLIQRGIDPFPARFHRTHTTAEALDAFVRLRGHPARRSRRRSRAG